MKIFSLFLLFFLLSCKCRDIYDIYTSEFLADTVGHASCRYTITTICEKDCQSYYISRNHYDQFMKEWDDLNIKRPFPRRDDKDQLNNPIGRWGRGRYAGKN